MTVIITGRLNVRQYFGGLMNYSSHLDKFIAGSCAGVTAVTLTYPLDTIRARLAFQITGQHVYTGIRHTAVSIFRDVGKFFFLSRIHEKFNFVIAVGHCFAQQLFIKVVHFYFVGDNLWNLMIVDFGFLFNNSYHSPRIDLKVAIF